MGQSKPNIKFKRLAYQGYYKTYEAELEDSQGQSFPYTLLELKNDAIMILATLPTGEFIINREYRVPCDEWLLSAPGGLINDKESFFEAARRELIEETGYSSNEFQLLGEAYPFPGITGQKIYFVKALNAVKKQEPSLDRGETIETLIYDKKSLESALKSEPVDGILLSLLQFNSLCT